MRFQEAVERSREITSTASKQETRASSLVENKHNSVANTDYQRGREMTSEAFISKLRSINLDIVLEPHPNAHLPWNKDKACLYLLLPDGKKEFLMVCENDWMPEWSVMEIKTTKEFDRQGRWIVRKIPGRELVRGWRTVLIKLILKRLISVTEAERVFGPGNRESWKVLTGKGPGILLV